MAFSDHVIINTSCAGQSSRAGLVVPDRANNNGELTLLPFNFDIGTLSGVIALFVMKLLILNQSAWPKEDWQKWMMATAVGLAVSVTVKYFFR